MSTPNCKRPLNDEDYKGLHAATSFLVEQDVCIHLCLSIQFVSNQTICGMRVGSSGYKSASINLLQHPVPPSVRSLRFHPGAFLHPAHYVRISLSWTRTRTGDQSLCQYSSLYASASRSRYYGGTLSVPSVPAHSKNVEITDFSTIGSYNWVKESTPTIIVPGSPPEWKSKATPFVDQNGFRMPSAMLAPLLIDVDKTSEVAGTSAFDWSEIDFVTDRNGLRKLLR
ncbi:hypothetical protein C8J57DRAFT_1521090 [Mycena rebaudengoi]|nr:hypothetical protein C8J57DRAFT_1521090 [Mycena rebaudengoi]